MCRFTFIPADRAKLLHTDVHIHVHVYLHVAYMYTCACTYNEKIEIAYAGMYM